MKSEKLIFSAISFLRPFFSCDFVFSSLYRTKPMYFENQSDFLNMVVAGKIKKDITPHSLLFEIHKIEECLGRNRALEKRNGPRSIDIDIEFFGNEHFSAHDLQIPHPRIFERPFVCVPLYEILPDFASSMKIPHFSETKDVFLEKSATDFPAFEGSSKKTEKLK